MPHPDPPPPTVRRVRAAGVETRVLQSGEGDVPVVCVHGNLDSADSWLPLLRRSGELGRVIAPDLPGFGRSERPDAGTFDGTVDAYVAWFTALIDELGITAYRLVVHDFGSMALAAAALRPGQLRGVVAIDVVPLSAAYRWHWLARYLWRPRVVAEVGALILNRFTVKTLSRLQRPGFRPLDRDLLDRIGRDLDPGSKRAILRLYRSAEPGVLGRHGERLSDVRCPALVVWGAQDPYVGITEMDVLAGQLGGPVRTLGVEGGHWPMFDTDEVFDEAVAFLRDPADGTDR